MSAGELGARRQKEDTYMRNAFTFTHQQATIPVKLNERSAFVGVCTPCCGDTLLSAAARAPISTVTLDTAMTASSPASGSGGAPYGETGEKVGIESCGAGNTVAKRSKIIGYITPHQEKINKLGNESRAMRSSRTFPVLCRRILQRASHRRCDICTCTSQ